MEDPWIKGLSGAKNCAFLAVSGLFYTKTLCDFFKITDFRTMPTIRRRSGGAAGVHGKATTIRRRLDVAAGAGYPHALHSTFNHPNSSRPSLSVDLLIWMILQPAFLRQSVISASV